MEGKDRQLKKSGRLSVLSDFLKEKISDSGWSIKKFSKEAGLGETYAYRLVSGRRNFTPTDETISKVVSALGFGKEEEKYILELAAREREVDGLIYPDDVDGEERIEEPVEADVSIEVDKSMELLDIKGKEAAFNPVEAEEAALISEEGLGTSDAKLIAPASLKATFKEAFREFLEEQKEHEVRSLEEQAFYRLGRLEEFVEHLNVEKRLLLEEFEKYKELFEFWEDREELEKQVECFSGEPEDITRKLSENTEHIRVLQRERELIQGLREEAEKEKDEAIRKLGEARAREEKLKDKLEELEKANKFMSKQLEEEWKPWWKITFFWTLILERSFFMF